MQMTCLQESGYPWKITDDKDDGTFQVGVAFNVKTGFYTAPKDGMYMVDAQVQFRKGGESDYVALYAAIDQKIDDAGLFSIYGEVKEGFETMRLAGTYLMKKGKARQGVTPGKSTTEKLKKAKTIKIIVYASHLSRPPLVIFVMQRHLYI